MASQRPQANLPGTPSGPLYGLTATPQRRAATYAGAAVLAGVAAGYVTQNR